MFFDEYDTSKLPSMWSAFAKVKKDYAPEERWSEIIDKSYKNAAFAALTDDNIIYDFYRNHYSPEDEKTNVPYVCTTLMIIMSKKANIDYGVEITLPAYEFTTYFETTRLHSLFEKTRDVAELKDDFKKYEDKIKELFPSDELTLWNLWNTPETAKQFADVCDDNENFGIGFIDAFTNMLVYDFVKNYMELPNDRNLNDIYKEADDCDEDCGYYDEDCDGGAKEESYCRNGRAYEEDGNDYGCSCDTACYGECAG